MLSKIAFAASAMASMAVAQSSANETVLGVYMFHRHGDRTAKAWPPANLTDLGYLEVYQSGQYYRNRYIDASADYKISGISSDLVALTQINVTAPADVVLMNSAQGFLQGLYPPVGNSTGSNVLASGQTVTSPMDGYQLIPVMTVSGSAGVENGIWLQAASGCAAATVSSNNFFSSAEYMSLLNSSAALYQDILPVVNGTYNSTADNFKNAYAIWDLINVALIHNSTINSSDLLTNSTVSQLFDLANAHEWGLAYNASDDMRAIAGKVLAGQIVQFLNSTITGAGKQKFGIQFGAYGTFSSLFGLTDLTLTNPDFFGITNYSSAMTFELFTNATSNVTKATYSNTDDIYVRFLFNNFTASDSNPPVAYPLFGSGQEAMSWGDFTTNMAKISISGNKQWCAACGNSTGTCAAYASGSSSGSGSNGSSSSGSSGNGLSPAVNGVIGAMVTLAVILGLEALVVLLGGFRVVKKGRPAQGDGAAGNGVAKA